jgi:hypothetical protein
VALRKKGNGSEGEGWEINKEQKRRKDEKESKSEKKRCRKAITMSMYKMI